VRHAGNMEAAISTLGIKSDARTAKRRRNQMNKYKAISDEFEKMAKQPAGRYGNNYRNNLIRDARKAQSAFVIHCHTCRIQTWHGFSEYGILICIKCGYPDKLECKCYKCWQLYKCRNYTS